MNLPFPRRLTPHPAWLTPLGHTILAPAQRNSEGHRYYSGTGARCSDLFADQLVEIMIDPAELPGDVLKRVCRSKHRIHFDTLTSRCEDRLVGSLDSFLPSLACIFFCHCPLRSVYG